MAIVIKTEVSNVALDNSGITLADTTGVYATPSNEGGYGAPNIELAAFTHVGVDFQMQGNNSRIIFSGLAADITTLQTSKLIEDDFADGVYTARLWMGLGENTADNFDTSVPNVLRWVTGAPRPLSDGYTHVSVLSDPYNKVAVASVASDYLVLSAELGATVEDLEDGVIYWFSGTTRFISASKTGLKLAQRLAADSCHCADDLEFYCMLLRVYALYNLEDYAGAQLKLTYLKQRLC